jgi:hypothetical protein
MKNVDGGVIEFDFDPPVNYVKNIGLLDVHYATVIRISVFNEDNDSPHLVLRFLLLAEKLLVHECLIHTTLLMARVVILTLVPQT